MVLSIRLGLLLFLVVGITSMRAAHSQSFDTSRLGLGLTTMGVNQLRAAAWLRSQGDPQTAAALETKGAEYLASGGALLGSRLPRDTTATMDEQKILGQVMSQEQVLVPGSHHVTDQLATLSAEYRIKFTSEFQGDGPWRSVLQSEGVESVITRLQSLESELSSSTVSATPELTGISLDQVLTGSGIASTHSNSARPLSSTTSGRQDTSVPPRDSNSMIPSNGLAYPTPTSSDATDTYVAEPGTSPLPSTVPSKGQLGVIQKGWLKGSVSDKKPKSLFGK